MRPFGVEILFRSWSSTSVENLTCGKLSHDWSTHEIIEQRLHDEFEQHKEEDLDQITIAFIAKYDSSSAKIHNARDLTTKSTFDEEELKKYDNEYLFEWRVSKDNVIHTVILSLVHRKEFNLKPCSLVENYYLNLNDLRGRIAKRIAFLTLFDKGYECGLAACEFGIKASIKELAREMSEWTVKGRYFDFDWTIVHKGIKEAMKSRVITMGVENRMNLERELLRLQAELDVLEDCYLDNVAKLVWELSHDQDSKFYWEVFFFNKMSVFKVIVNE